MSIVSSCGGAAGFIFHHLHSVIDLLQSSDSVHHKQTRQLNQSQLCDVILIGGSRCRLMWHTCSTCHSEGSRDRADTVMKSGISLHFRNKQQEIIQGWIHHGCIHASSIIWYTIHFQNETILVTEMERGVIIRRMVISSKILSLQITLSGNCLWSFARESLNAPTFFLKLWRATELQCDSYFGKL